MFATTLRQTAKAILGEILVRKGLISQAELEQALAEQSSSQKKLGEILIEKNLIPQEKLEKIIEKQYWQKNGFWLIS